MLRFAVLGDFRDVAREMALWERLGDDVELTVLTEHVEGGEALTAAIGEAEVVAPIRERTAFGRGRLRALPRPRLLNTPSGS